MTPGARASAAIAVLDRVLAGTAVEQALTGWARGARYAGSTDRAEVRDIVFQCLRCRVSYAALGGGLTGRGLVLGFVRSLPAEEAAAVFAGGPHDPAPPDSVTEAGHAPVGVEAFDIPDWLETPLRQSLGRDFEAVLQAMQRRAPVYLRVNPAKASPTEAITLLAQDGITARGCALPLALEVTGGERKIKVSQAYLGGAVDLQDLSSQAVVAALPLADGMRVLDHCAGGGGKTLAMAAEARLQLYAHDIAPQRMADLPGRAERAGVKVTRIEQPEAAAPYDLVLVDAPCSGSGSWRRDPAGKWALTPERLEALVAVQAAILDRTAVMVRSGGLLAYVTCSFLAAENYQQIQSFLARQSGWELLLQRQLTPLTHSDGFYLALLGQRTG